MKWCERFAQHKPVYETPKVSKLDEMETYLGLPIGPICQDGSGDSLGCTLGNAATGNGCAGDGNSATGNGCDGAGNSASKD